MLAVHNITISGSRNLSKDVLFLFIKKKWKMYALRVKFITIVKTIYKYSRYRWSLKAMLCLMRGLSF
jgi:hypothetical protein